MPRASSCDESVFAGAVSLIQSDTIGIEILRAAMCSNMYCNDNAYLIPQTSRVR